MNFSKDRNPWLGSPGVGLFTAAILAGGTATAGAFELRDLLVNPFNVSAPAIAAAEDDESEDLVTFVQHLRRASPAPGTRSDAASKAIACLDPVAVC